LSNALLVIQPYWSAGTWVFDDANVALVREPFVQGIPEMINILVQDIPAAKKGFRMIFSHSPFPGYQAMLARQEAEYGGTWYEWQEHELRGWLCPALFKYFPAAPFTLYVKAEPLK
jgi:hypothetical protein